MTDDIRHPDNAENRSDEDDHQHPGEACQHAIDALRNGNLSHATRTTRTIARSSG